MPEQNGARNFLESSMDRKKDFGLSKPYNIENIHHRWKEIREINLMERRPPTLSPEEYRNMFKQLMDNVGRFSDSKNKVIKNKVFRKSKKGVGNVKSNSNKNDLIKQADSISELLSKLNLDLRLSYSSFLREFISAPCDGIILLLFTLRVLQLSQDKNFRKHGMCSTKEQYSEYLRSLADEYKCLHCIKCCTFLDEAVICLIQYDKGLLPLAMSTLSHAPKSRILALEIMCRVCEMSSKGYDEILESFSKLRFKMEEPVRFKLLINQLHGSVSPTFKSVCLRLLNHIVEGAYPMRKKVFIQEEIIEAGLDIIQLEKSYFHCGIISNQFEGEIKRWNVNYIDVESLLHQVADLRGKLKEMFQVFKREKHKNCNKLAIHRQLSNFENAEVKNDVSTQTPSTLTEVSDQFNHSVGEVKMHFQYNSINNTTSTKPEKLTRSMDNSWEVCGDCVKTSEVSDTESAISIWSESTKSFGFLQPMSVYANGMIENCSSCQDTRNFPNKNDCSKNFQNTAIDYNSNKNRSMENTHLPFNCLRCHSNTQPTQILTQIEKANAKLSDWPIRFDSLSRTQFGFIEKGHRNDGLYSGNFPEFPTPDYSFPNSLSF